MLTLILSLNSPYWTVMASGRLVTLAHSATGRYLRDFDRLSNKMVVAVLADALVAIGYTGSAFVGNKHTDDWIAETAAPGANLIGSPSIFGLRVSSSLRLHQLCNRIRLGLAAAAVWPSTAVHVTGWRTKGYRQFPISVVLSPSVRLGPDPRTRLRFRRERGTFIFGHVGANLNAAEFGQGYASVTGRPFDPNTARDMLTNMIRSKAAIDPSVGPHVMSVILHHPTARRIEAQFDPLQPHRASQTIEGRQAHQVVGFSPWVLLPTAYVAPAETTDGGFGTLQNDQWTVEITDATSRPVGGCSIHWSLPQHRVGCR